jgi:hypothetical protein
VVASLSVCIRFYGHTQVRRNRLWALVMLGIACLYFVSQTTFNPFFEATLENNLFYLALGGTVGRWAEETHGGVPGNAEAAA